MLTLYGISSCDTCRKAKKWLVEQSIEFSWHDLRDSGLDRQMLDRWTERMDWRKFLNTRSLTWRKIPEVDRAGIDRERAIGMMLEHPTLVKRPVLEGEEFIAVGFSSDNYRRMFDSL